MSASIILPGTQEHKIKLNYFGLNDGIFQDVSNRIFGDYNKATPNDAKSAGGSYAFFAGIRALRDILCPLGWHKHCEGNIEMVLAPLSQFAITASSGDKNTGIDGKEPKTKNHKGSETVKLILKNQSESYSLFPETELSPIVFDPNRIPTWFLLYHIDLAKNEVRMELSLPVSIDIYNMRINDWKERIILSTVRFDGTPINKINLEESYLDFDIEIKRKNNE